MDLVRLGYEWVSEKISDNRVFIKIALGVYILLLLYSYVMTERPVFFYNKKVTLFNKLLEETRLKRISYRPYVMAPNPFMQFFFYLTTELFIQTFKSPKFVREEITLKDGGLVALDWSIEKDGTAYPVRDSNGRPTKPILIVFPGLSGENNNLYTISVLRKARKLGYKCCTVITRGCSGLPLKTAMISNPDLPDTNDVIQYVHDKYIIDPKTGKKQQKLLAYGVSLGAIFLAIYLIKYGKNVPLDAAVLYGAIWHTIEDLDYFNNNFYGFYNRGLIFPVRMMYNKVLLPQLRHLMEKESFEQMCKEINEAKYLREIDNAVHVRLCKYQHVYEYYGKCAIRGRLKHIKVPTLHISADDDQIFEQLNDKFPRMEAEEMTNSSVLLCKTSRGNHVCHMTGFFWPKQWIQKPTFTFLNYFRDYDQIAKDR